MQRRAMDWGFGVAGYLALNVAAQTPSVWSKEALLILLGGLLLRASAAVAFSKS